MNACYLNKLIWYCNIGSLDLTELVLIACLQFSIELITNVCSTVEAQCKHSGSTVQAQCKHTSTVGVQLCVSAVDGQSYLECFQVR